jgi:hypothetical protein
MLLTSSPKELKSLPQPALGLLPAVHDASVTPWTSGALPAPVAGSVLRNDAASAMPLPAYGGWPAASVPPGGYAGSDGNLWYPVVHRAGTTSYYPQAFERRLYTLAFSAFSLPLKASFDLARAFDFRLFANSTDATWRVVWEIGLRTDQTTPAPIGPNLDAYTWREPLIDVGVHLTDVLSTHTMRVIFSRSAVGSDEVWEGTVERYGMKAAATAAQLPPANVTDFVLRLRLAAFDTLSTPDDLRGQRGYVGYFCYKPTPEGATE